MPSSVQKLVSVVTPAYNEAAAIGPFLSHLCDALAKLPYRFEIVVVDDGSSDPTREAVLSAKVRGAEIRYVRLSRNFGKEAAISAGLETARGAAVIVMDSDGQHPANYIATFLERWEDGAEVVAAVQESRAESAPKQLVKAIYYRLLEGSSQSARIPRNAGDFRLMDRKVVNAINALPERNRLMKGLYAWVGFRTEFVLFQAEPRLAGQTKFSWAKLFALGITGLTAFSVVPLRLVSLAGVLVSILSLLYGAYLLVEHYAFGTHLPGWATISVGMMFLSGLQLLALGVIAEYVGRTFEEAKRRPLYIVAEEQTIQKSAGEYAVGQAAVQEPMLVS